MPPPRASRTTSAVNALWAVLALSCSPTAPTATPVVPSAEPPTVVVPATPIASTATPPLESPRPDAWIPAPFAIVARAPDGRVFRKYEMDGRELVAVCYDGGMAGGCLEPVFGELQADGTIVPNVDASAGLPPLRFDNLANDPGNLFKRFTPKATTTVRYACAKAPYYPGPRTLDAMYGRWPDSAWAVVHRCGEEFDPTVVSSLFRWSKGRWEHVHTTGKQGVAIVRVFPWQGGALALVRENGVLRFESYQTRSGVRVPKLPHDLYSEIATHVFEDQSIIAYDQPLDSVGMRLMAWDARGVGPTTIELPRVAQRYDGGDQFYDMRIEVDPAEVRIKAWGQTPIQDSLPKDGITFTALTATVTRTGGRWSVTDQRYLTKEEEASILKTSDPWNLSLEELENARGVDIRDRWTTKNGDLYVGVHRREGDHIESILLRTRPSERVWTMPAAEFPDTSEPPMDPACVENFASESLF